MAYAMGMRFASRFGRFAARALRRVPRVLRRRAPLRRLMRKKIQNKIHKFVRWADKDTQYPGSSGPNIVLATPGNQHLAYTFKLDNVVNAADFVNLYDSYRINKVVLYLERLRNSTGDNLNSPYNGKIAVVHDYNDANPLTDEDEYLEYSNCKRYSIVGNGPIKITLYPKINNTIENVGGSAGYISSNSNRVWLNTADDAVPHFGLKVFIPGGVLTEGQVLFTVRAKFWLSLKNSK